MTYQVRLDDFEGPLDLLLHLIRKNELDIYKISVSVIAEQYLQYVEIMRTLNLDNIGEFLLMAATLAYHKSKMLLPDTGEKDDEEEEAFESLEDLHRRLIEYQRYKEAAEELYARPILDRDVFRGVAQRPEEVEEETTPPMIQASLFDLLDAFREVLRKAPEKTFHDVTVERVRLLDRIVEVMDYVLQKGRVRFEDLFPEQPSRMMIVVTFLSILELVRLRLIHAYQGEPFGSIDLAPSVGHDDHKAMLKEGLRIHES